MAGRLYHLDALRSFCMLFGIFVHAGSLDSSAWPSWTSSVLSEHFRMATFFVISGFFAALMLERRGLSGFARHRTLSLVVPLITGLILLNPATLWLVYQVKTGPVSFGSFLSGMAPPATRPLNWHLHLWFLFTLIAYMAMLPALIGALRGSWLSRTVAWILTVPGSVGAVTVAVFMILGEIAGRAIFALVFEPFVGGTPVSWLFRATLQYLPYFLLGAACFLHKDLFAFLHRVSWPLLVLGLVASALRAWLGLPGGIGTLAEIVAEETLTVAVMLALFALFRRFLSRPLRSVEILNDAVYSIYLLHYGLIYALAWWIFGDVTPFELKFFAISAATFAIALLIHRFVIRPVPVLYLLFNGKRRLAPSLRTA